MQGYIIPEVANVLTNRRHKGINTTCDEGQTLIAFDSTQITHPANGSTCKEGDPCHTLPSNGHPPAIAFGHCDSDPTSNEEMSPTLRTGSQSTGNVAVAFNWQQGGNHTTSLASEVDKTPTLQVAQGIAVAVKPSHFTRGKDGAPSEIAPPLSAEADKGDQEAIVFQSQPSVAYTLKNTDKAWKGDGADNLLPSAAAGYRVRRLTPRECERLQGFPDDYTLIPDRNGSENWAWELEEVRDYFQRSGKKFTDEEIIRLTCDGVRYKALGNSIAIPCLRWIGERIQAVDSILNPDQIPQCQP